jgi:hypothetical protein
MEAYLLTDFKLRAAFLAVDKIELFAENNTVGL